LKDLTQQQMHYIVVLPKSMRAQVRTKMPALAVLWSDSRKELVADANVTVNQYQHSKLGDDYDIHASIRD
jgi:hypothetical protein